MQLDVPTLMVMGSFVAACSGAILLAAWWANRRSLALALWGCASILSAAGILGLMLGPLLREPLFLIIGGKLLAVAHGMIWQSARAIDAKRAPIAVVLLGAAILFAVSLVPSARPLIASLGLSINAAYLFAAAFSLWRGRAERLPARWPIVFFLVMHATILTIGTYSTLAISDALDQIPPLMSFFGIIHFESTIFSVGTAVFLLALFKERSEMATRAAAGLDSLTGVANRAAFMEAAARVLERSKRDNVPVSVIMFDLDDFKAINDTHGHAVGDAVIQKFCEVTVAALRPDDVFGRLGGEEFAVVMGRSSIEPAYVRAERIRVAFASECRMIGGQPINATVSGGVAVSMQAENTLSELLKFSDEALYRAKAAGRNRIRRAGQLALEGGSSAVIRVA